jgi:hypothetical protein
MTAKTTVTHDSVSPQLLGISQGASDNRTRTSMIRRRVFLVVALGLLALVPPPGSGKQCDPSYPEVCIPSPPPDLDCPDVPYRRFRVIGADPHGFDRDRDGIGCER